ncbi:hypothetical protein Tco_0946803 [Tanacetum coccineum]
MFLELTQSKDSTARVNAAGTKLQLLKDYNSSRIKTAKKIKFNLYKDAKTLMRAIENRFGGNIVTKKTQKNLLKQQYENFAASSIETMHTIVWMNKPEIKTLSLDDLFNNLKAYESEVKGTSSSTTNSHNVAFLSSSSTNSATRAVNTAQGINTASTKDAADSSTTV